MKNIGYIDKAERKTMQIYYDKNVNDLFRLKKIDRITNALNELKHMGNINIYYIDGNKTRLILSKGI